MLSRLFTGTVRCGRDLRIGSSRLYHNDTENPYHLLMERMDRSIMKMPINDMLESMLTRLVSEDEALFLSKLPRGLVFKSSLPKTFPEMTQEEIDTMLFNMFDRGMLFENDELYFHFPEYALGWFEFLWMRERGELPLEELAHLSREYLHKHYFVNPLMGESIGGFRTLLPEELMPSTSVVLDHESAMLVVDHAERVGVAPCTCQANFNEKHPEKEINEKYNTYRCICLDYEGDSFGYVDSLQKYGMCEEVTKEEAKDIITECRDNGFVTISDVTDGPVVLCNCPKEVCTNLEGIRMKLNGEEGGSTEILRSSRFIAQVDPQKCVLCGTCVEKCPIDLYSINEEFEDLVFLKEHCLGCGVCVQGCTSGALSMIEREDYVSPTVPKDTLHKALILAKDLRRLHTLAFPYDNLLVSRLGFKALKYLEERGYGKYLFPDIVLEVIHFGYSKMVEIRSNIERKRMEEEEE